ncbi:hypothetical protein CsSME_00022212 [Camellia sinensis var. sinensis]
MNQPVQKNTLYVDYFLAFKAQTAANLIFLNKNIEKNVKESMCELVASFSIQYKLDLLPSYMVVLNGLESFNGLRMQVIENLWRHKIFFRRSVNIFIFFLNFSVWADADTWFERQQQEEEMQRIQAENRATMEAAEELHRKKMAQEREGEKEEETDTKDDPMARAEAEVLKQDSS